MRIVFLFLIAALFFSFSANASSHIDVNIINEEYHPGDTLQAEINANTAKPINSQDIWIRDSSGNKIKISPFLSK